ncbi:hypothetical protein Tco_0460850 [Tanacetum coccineum]
MGLRCVSSMRGLRSALQANDLGPSYQPPRNPSILDPWIVCTSHPPIGLLGIAIVSRLCCQNLSYIILLETQERALREVHDLYVVRLRRKVHFEERKQANQKRGKQTNEHRINDLKLCKNQSSNVHGDTQNVVTSGVFGHGPIRYLSQLSGFLCSTQKLIQNDGSLNVRASTTQPYVVGELHKLSSSCNSQNTQLLLNLCGSQRQLQPDVPNMMTHLHSNLDVFQKYYDLCTGNAGPQYTTVFKGTTSDVQRDLLNSGKRKVKPYDGFDVFQAYSALCSRNMKPRRSSDSSQAAGVTDFNVMQTPTSDFLFMRNCLNGLPRSINVATMLKHVSIFNNMLSSIPFNYPQLSIQHWKDSWHKKVYKQNQKKVRKNPEDYYSNHGIIEVVRIITNHPHGLDFMEQTIVMRANDKPDKFSEDDFKYLNKNDIEDLYYLCRSKEIDNRKVKLMNLLITFIRSYVIWERVLIFQLGIESYQMKVNLTAPTLTFLGIEEHAPYIIVDEPQMGLIYLNSKDEKRVMYLEEIVKFCDATLEKVLNEVKLRMFKSKFLKKPPLLGELDQDIMKAYEREISKRLSHRQQMRRWESFVNERPILQTMKHL